MGSKRNAEFDNFDAAVRKILSVTHEELKRREEEWQREQALTRKKPGPKPKRKSKTSASDRASGGKD
jgi:hypothetical protein